MGGSNEIKADSIGYTGEKGNEMKSYIISLATYDMDGQPVDYDYGTAAELWGVIDELNEQLHYHTASLTETASCALVISAESNGTNTVPARLERLALARHLERIADEYGAFELPARLLMAEPELNEMISNMV